MRAHNNNATVDKNCTLNDTNKIIGIKIYHDYGDVHCDSSSLLFKKHSSPHIFHCWLTCGFSFSLQNKRAGSNYQISRREKIKYHATNNQREKIYNITGNNWQVEQRILHEQRIESHPRFRLPQERKTFDRRVVTVCRITKRTKRQPRSRQKPSHNRAANHRFSWSKLMTHTER